MFHWEGRALDAEAKLTKAVEALREIAGSVPYADNPWHIALAAPAVTGGEEMSEVRLKPIVTEDPDGDTVITFTEDHTIRDILRYLLSTGAEASELIYHINDPTLLSELKRTPKMLYGSIGVHSRGRGFIPLPPTHTQDHLRCGSRRQRDLLQDGEK